MIWNPEFRKNIQLDFNAVKLVLVPLVLGMIFAISYLSVEKNEPAAPQLQLTALILFTVLVFVWGTKMVVESLISEFNDRTWDSQRMTAISPWSLAGGKLIGSSLVAWYGGLFCLLVFAAASAAVPAHEAQLMRKSLLTLLFAGGCIQTALFAFILTEFAKKREADKIALSSYSVFGVLLLAQVASFVAGAYHTDTLMHWHGIALYPLDMMLYSSVFFCLWGIIGMHRAMRKELQFENRPTAWVLFLLSLMIYCTGFIPPDFDIHAAALLFICCWMSFMIAISSFYVMLLAEPKHLVDFRLLITRIQQGAWSALTVKIPAWFISLLFTTALCCLILLLQSTADLSSLHKDYTFLLKLLPLTLLAFCLRDLGLVLYVNFSSTKKNRDLTALFYLAILYLLVPLLLKIAGAEFFLPWFVPSYEASLLNAVLPIMAQAGFALYFAGKKLRQHSA